MTSSSESLPTPPPPDPSSLRVDCPNCAQAFAIRPSMRGKAVVCPHCQQSVELSEAASSAGTASRSLPQATTFPPGVPPILPPADASEIPTLQPKQDSSSDAPQPPPIAAKFSADQRASQDIEAPPVDHKSPRAPSRNIDNQTPSGEQASRQVEPRRERAAPPSSPSPVRRQDQVDVSRSMQEASSVGTTDETSARRRHKEPGADRKRSGKSKRASKSDERQKATSGKERSSSSRQNEDDLPLLPPGAAEPAPPVHAVDELLPPTSYSSTESANELAAESTDLAHESASPSVSNAEATDEVRLPDGEGGFIVASSRIVTVHDGQREIKLQRLDRQSQNQRRSRTSLIVFGVCVVTLVVSIALLRWLFGG